MDNPTANIIAERVRILFVEGSRFDMEIAAPAPIAKAKIGKAISGNVSPAQGACSSIE